MSNEYAQKVMWSTIYNAGKIGALEHDETINVAVGKRHVMIVSKYCKNDLTYFDYSILLDGLTIESVSYTNIQVVLGTYADFSMLAFD